MRKAIFFYFINDNLFHFQKEPTDIKVYVENLIFSPVEVTKASELSISFDFKIVCNQKKKISNTSPINQIVKLAKCNYASKETISFEITAGLNNTNKNLQEPTSPVLNAGDAAAILEFLNLNGQSNFERKTLLSNSFDLSTLNKHSQEMILDDFVEGQDIVVPPKQRILIKHSVRI